jgi:hypothetical protein
MSTTKGSKNVIRPTLAASVGVAAVDPDDMETDSATQVEYRITSWLALLGTVSTIGRDSVLLQVSRDY